MATALEVAAYIKAIYLDAGLSEKDISKRRVMKLMYFAQMRHLSTFGVSLFPETQVEAWDFGPVVPFDAYKDYKASYEMCDEDAKDSILDVMLEVGSLEGDELSDLSHNIGVFEQYYDGTPRKVIPNSAINDSWNEFVHAVRNAPYLKKLTIAPSIDEKLMSLAYAA